MVFSNFMRTASRLKLCCSYLEQKIEFAIMLTFQRTDAGLVPGDFFRSLLRSGLTGKMTYFYMNKGLEMEPTISAPETLLVRKLPYLNSKLWLAPQQIHVGDIVVLKDPLDSANHVVRRLAAVSGYEIASTNKEDEPFVLKDGQCWVLSDNKNLKPGENNDSRTYGPISVTDIVGRVVFRFRARNNHGLVINSKTSLQSDMAVVFIELDITEVPGYKDEKS